MDQRYRWFLSQQAALIRQNATNSDYFRYALYTLDTLCTLLTLYPLLTLCTLLTLHPLLILYTLLTVYILLTLCTLPTLYTLLTLYTLHTLKPTACTPRDHLPANCLLSITVIV